MKIIALALLTFVAIFATGCSSTPTSTAVQSPTAVTQSTQEDINPELKNVKFVRAQLTDPSLYDFLQSSSLQSSLKTTSSLSSEEQKKIGVSAKFPNSSKYGISGLAKIISVDTVRLESFSYNGACGNLVVALTISNNLKNYVEKIKTVSTPVSATTIDMPINVSLIKFDSVSLYCTNSQDPVSTASLNL